MKTSEWTGAEETDAQIENRATNATSAMRSAINGLRSLDLAKELAAYIVFGKEHTHPSRDDAHTRIGAMLMATKAIAARLGVSVSIVASAKHETEDGHNTVVGCDSWAPDLFLMAQLQSQAAGATMQAHRWQMQRQIDRLEDACDVARETGSEMAVAFFDRTCVKVQQPGGA